MDASLTDFLIQFTALSAIGGFGFLIYTLNHSGEKAQNKPDNINGS